ncbi:MAG TPA: DNA cytosine methyltransferase [Planctomycetota bacterium]|nr:DNA cytosine methyltransferase [Planctomycetota bacterium]
MANSATERLIQLIADSPISAVDLFCGCGGLTYGLRQAGIRVVAGIDIDPQMEYAYATNNPGATFIRQNVATMRSSDIAGLFDLGKCRLLAGCAPCQPFSKLTNGIRKHRAWGLLDHFGRFVADILPEIVTMENVPELADRGGRVFSKFIAALSDCGYRIDWCVVNCAEYGIPQSRKRLVLLASRLGEIRIPPGRYKRPSQWRTVRQTIGQLRPLEAGEEDPSDPLHAASRLSPVNMERIRATRPDGGTRHDWPDRLVLDCHRKKSGERYFSIYGRMWWDRPAPTMTTLCTGIGNGRFGHPEQDRSITLREAALFQTFPRDYRFWPPDQKVNRKAVGRMIGNAVPPKLARELGRALMEHIATIESRGRLGKRRSICRVRATS